MNILYKFVKTSNNMARTDWNHIGFKYRKPKVVVTATYKDGKWSLLQTQEQDTIQLNVMAPCLHYGLEVFEGLKAYRGQDGRVRLFRPQENAMRMQRSAAYCGMACPSVDQFVSAVKLAVRENIALVPPYESGASMYVRPVLLATNPQVDLHMGTEFLFMVVVMPVGAYGTGGLQTIKGVIDRDHDRAAPRGTGCFKVGGNYASVMRWSDEVQAKGYQIVLYTDPREQKYIDEFATSNFFAVKGKKYITPASGSILPSVTNKSLCQLAEHLGYTVERRQILVEELADFDEVCACGTAVVLTPVSQIDDPDKGRSYTFHNGQVGPVSEKLYTQLRALQWGDIPDPFGWVDFV